MAEDRRWTPTWGRPTERAANLPAGARRLRRTLDWVDVSNAVRLNTSTRSGIRRSELANPAAEIPEPSAPAAGTRERLAVGSGFPARDHRLLRTWRRTNRAASPDEGIWAHGAVAGGSVGRQQFTPVSFGEDWQPGPNCGGTPGGGGGRCELAAIR